MPTYEYACGRCHHRFDVRQGFHDEPLATCPKCKSAARRVFQPVPIVFKGSGFYCTDHGKSGMVGSTKHKEVEEFKEKVDSTPPVAKKEEAKASADAK
ncbi:MAG: hypothetical protein HYX92_08000 [Chloroflexi bacterium]|nr:hypothetical protein [Chloroflexota bacterium]